MFFVFGGQKKGLEVWERLRNFGVETKNEKLMGKFINPFTDVGFKLIFGQEINKDLLIDLT